MPPKTKRTAKEREDGTALDDTLPAKRLRTEDTHTGTVESHNNGVAPPAQVEEPLEQDEEPEEEEEEVAEVVPAPILGDLYLETVDVPFAECADGRSIDQCWNSISKKFVR
jgi:hypothetical protein